MNNNNRLAAEEVLHKRVVAHPVPLPRQRRHRRVVGPVPCAIVFKPSLSPSAATYEDHRA